MQMTAKAWLEYISGMSAIDQKAVNLMQRWIDKHGTDDRASLIAYADALIQRYGQASGALACEMYEATAAAQGVAVPAAEMAELPSYAEVGKAINGTLKVNQKVPNTVGRLVKQVGADTTLKNAKRDGAQFAWVPHGDTCAFCITLASRGWQHMSKNALRNGHAEHIHAHCDCQYAIRFDGKSTVEGYDPDKCLRMYENADGSTSSEKINAMRRVQYRENKGEINEQKREAYRARKALEEKGTKKITAGDSTKAGNRGKLSVDELYPVNPVTGQSYAPHTLTVDNAQFGAKIGKHAQDYGLDPSSESTREFFRNEINRIVSDADERHYGDWRGQEYPVVFHIKGDDVVVESKDGEFITILKGGVSNARVKNAGK